MMPKSQLERRHIDDMSGRSVIFSPIFDNIFAALLRRFCKPHDLGVTLREGTGKLAISNEQFAIECDISFARRLLFAPVSASAELTIGDGYTSGEWKMVSGKLEDVLSAIWNVSNDKTRAGTIRKLLGRRRFFHQQLNDPPIARKNIKYHYDKLNKDNTLFENMLGETMSYSSAIFENREQSLEEGQINKIEKIIELLALNPGEKILDIGSGWGTLTRAIAARSCHVTGITLSEEQLDWCKRNVVKTANGSEEYQLADYRNYFSQNQNELFDKITCVEVLDHIGKSQFDEFFRVVRNHLNHKGVFFLQLIARPHPGQTSTWIDKRIYPGGYIAALSEVEESYNKAGFALDTCTKYPGFHYAETLRRWRENFSKSYPKMERELGLDAEFENRWRFFLAYSISAFENAGFCNYHLKLLKS